MQYLHNNDADLRSYFWKQHREIVLEIIFLSTLVKLSENLWRLQHISGIARALSLQLVSRVWNTKMSLEEGFSRCKAKSSIDEPMGSDVNIERNSPLKRIDNQERKQSCFSVPSRYHLWMIQSTSSPEISFQSTAFRAVGEDGRRRNKKAITILASFITWR